VPPARYGGVERIVGVIAVGLVERGHDVTLFAPGDSTFPGRLVPTVPVGLWNAGFAANPRPRYERTVELVLDAAGDFDVIHSHLDLYGFALAEQAPVPVISTFHGRTDIDPQAAAIRSHPDVPLVAISHAQRRPVPDANWLATIYHGLDFSNVPDYSAREPAKDGYLAFVGRLSPDKGIAQTIELARGANRVLRVAAKALDPVERGVYAELIAPAVAEGVVEYMGELAPADRDQLMGEALATVMLSTWPEPFGLVAIESMALGTPLIASRAGALPEIVVDGVDGFVVDDVAAGGAAVARVARLDRARIRQRTLTRFAAARMIDDYERLFVDVLSQRSISKPR
jgi:glycosyltransferase involved in cell wall biosynthesis